MEKGEGQARDNYRGIAEYIPEAVKIAAEEDEHEQRLIEIIREEKLDYVGSMILGLNDALVELTGALAGFTLALQSTSLVAATGLITGIAASLSMGGTAYLATKSEQSGKSPLKSAMYTFLSYIITVILLVSPYLIFDNLYLALAIMLGIVILIILGFNFYVSVARNTSFWKRFGEMAILSLGIAAISFGIGYLVRHFLGVDI
jgi:VIT1/CCC1 family predicted Fe2+/Mn2+ transporter